MDYLKTFRQVRRTFSLNPPYTRSNVKKAYLTSHDHFSLCMDGPFPSFTIPPVVTKGLRFLWTLRCRDLFNDYRNSRRNLRGWLLTLTNIWRLVFFKKRYTVLTEVVDQLVKDFLYGFSSSFLISTSTEVPRWSTLYYDYLGGSRSIHVKTLSSKLLDKFVVPGYHY